MKAAIVLLSDSLVQNFTRRIVVELSQRQPLEFFTALLPAHVSLKQPFSFESLDALDRYTDQLADQIEPFEIQLDRFYADEWNGTGILGLHVVESPTLRGLHNRLNRDLARIVADPSAAHDGPDYRFHLTIEMGPFSGQNPFQAYLASRASAEVQLAFTARELGVFFYQGEPHRAGSFTTYRILPLRGRPSGIGMA